MRFHCSYLRRPAPFAEKASAHNVMMIALVRLAHLRRGDASGLINSDG